MSRASFPAPPRNQVAVDDVASRLLSSGGEFRQCVLLVAPSQIAKSDTPRQGVCPVDIVVEAAPRYG